MTKLDWLKFVGVYAGIAAFTLVLDALWRGQSLGAPVRGPITVMLGAMPACSVVMRANGPGRPLPRQLLLASMAALAALGALTVAIVWSTVGWLLGTTEPLVTAAVVAVLWSLVLDSKWMRARAAAANANDRPA